MPGPRSPLQGLGLRGAAAGPTRVTEWAIPEHLVATLWAFVSDEAAKRGPREASPQGGAASAERCVATAREGCWGRVEGLVSRGGLC